MANVYTISLAALAFSINIVTAPLVDESTDYPTPSAVILPTKFSPPDTYETVVPYTLADYLHRTLEPTKIYLTSSTASIEVSTLGHLASFIRTTDILDIYLELTYITSLVPSSYNAVTTTSSPLGTKSTLLGIFESIVFDRNSYSASIVDTSAATKSRLPFERADELHSRCNYSV